MDDGVDAAMMEICAAAMFLVRASPSDLAVKEEDAMDEDEVGMVAGPVEMWIWMLRWIG